jgi:hypothetical protein
VQTLNLLSESLQTLLTESALLWQDVQTNFEPSSAEPQSPMGTSPYPIDKLRSRMAGRPQLGRRNADPRAAGAGSIC